jgi:peptidoglycan/LPS O-acetylase OafA/YrhL
MDGRRRAGSFAWSIYITASSPGTAYYSTFARAWELALGAALAVAAPHLGRLPGRPARRGEAGSALDESNDRGERPQAGVGFVNTLGWFCAIRADRRRGISAPWSSTGR